MTIRNKVIVGASVVAAAYSIYKIKPLCESFPLKKRDKVYGNNRNSIRKSSSRRSTSSRRSGSLRSRRNHSSKSNRISKSSSGRKSKSRSGKRSKSRSGRRSNRRSSKRSRTRSGKSSRKRSGKRSRKRSDKRSRTRSGRRSRSRKSKSRSRSRSRKKNSAKCSKCMIVQKKLQHYSELVAGYYINLTHRTIIITGKLIKYDNVYIINLIRFKNKPKNIKCTYKYVYIY